jgi:hypothetical protein
MAGQSKFVASRHRRHLDIDPPKISRIPALEMLCLPHCSQPGDSVWYRPAEGFQFKQRFVGPNSGPREKRSVFCTNLAIPPRRRWTQLRAGMESIFGASDHCHRGRRCERDVVVFQNELNELINANTQPATLFCRSNQDNLLPQ